MVHLGDIKKIKRAPFVDCVTFGSPCQDLSIAGNRAGLAGERSGLFMDAVRIIREMEEQSGGLYPTFAVWENVQGAFSSNKGEDFRAVVEELAKVKEPGISIPRPENGKWAKAGFICGDGWSIAWRTLDAQFWGVPQRRRRIALVMDFRGQRAGEILFEPKGVSGHLKPSITPWQGVARNPAHSVAGHDWVVETAIPINTQIATRHISLGERTGMGWGEDGDPAYTLQAGHEHAVLCAAFTAGQGAKANGIGWAEEQAPTLRTDGGLSAMPTVLCRSHGQSAAETLEDCAPTLSCNYKQPIVFESHSQDARYTQQGDTTPRLHGAMGHRREQYAAGSVLQRSLQHGQNASCSLGIESGDISPTIRADTHPSGVAYKRLRWVVRRLTPTECERLQGFPDGWTDIGDWTDSKGKRHKAADSPRYKALGNSIALPQWWWLTCKMARHLPERATLGSLFDGIGGFPLVWETQQGKGTAVWASEIEPFCIAVTKKHFVGNEI